MKARSDVPFIYACGGILLLITAWIYWDYFRPEWKSHQSEFRALVTQRFGEDRARQVPAGIQQIWVADLNRADRCVTCHLGMEWTGLEDAPHPYRSHPPEILKKHPLSRYGCTICHGGQGYATELESAHATNLPHWEEPLLDSKLAQVHQIAEPRALLQINCNLCHRYDTRTEGADYINYAKQLVEENRCSMCHKMAGQGGLIGPDLTFAGNQSPEHFDYTRLPGKPSVFAWHVAHFKDPKSVSPDTLMPNLHLADRDAQALAMLVLSWRKMDIPSGYFPPPNTTPPETREVESGLSSGGRGSAPGQ